MSQGAVSTAKRRTLSEEARIEETFDLRLIQRLVPFVRPHRVYLLLALASYPVVAGLGIAQPYLVKLAVDLHFLPRNLDGFSWLVLALVGAMVLEFLAKLGQTIVTQILGQRVTRDLRAALFRKLQEVDLAFIERNPVGRLMTRVTNDVESLQETFSTGAISILGDIVLIIGIVIMMLFLDWRLTLSSFAVLPVLALFVRFMRLRAREAFREVRSHLSWLNAFLAEALAGMRLVQVFEREQKMHAEFDDVNSAYRDANFRAIRYDAMTYAVVEALSTVASACLIGVGLGIFDRGDIDIGVFVAFVDLLRRFFAPITELSTKYTMLQSAFASAERCIELLDEEPNIREKEPKPDFRSAMQTGFQFDDVWFSYGKEGGPFVLKGLSFHIAKGEKVAVVGPTGAGKSTLVKLLCRFYDPSQGHVRLDGVPLSDMAIADVRRRFSVVLQDPYLFDGTLRENIAYGAESNSMEALTLAARRTEALRLVETHEDGWNRGVGERGSRLSSGERQLVAFARAMARDPECLILDEATSSVDPETEALIQQGQTALLEGRSALIIAHRLSTIQAVDRIIVLSSGQVVEQGSHSELLAMDGLYRKLYELQFADGE